MTRAARIAALATAAAVVAACDRVANRVVPALTTEPASWSYVDEAWGGLAVMRSDIMETQLWIRLQAVHRPTRLDSAICECGINARAEAGRIAVRLDRCLCGEGTHAGDTVALPKPAAGTYDVVYDDAAAGFPPIGRVTVP